MVLLRHERAVILKVTTPNQNLGARAAQYLAGQMDPAEFRKAVGETLHGPSTFTRNFESGQHLKHISLQHEPEKDDDWVEFTFGGTPRRHFWRAVQGSAWMSREEDVKARIAPGQYADFAVLSAEDFSVPDREIRNLVSMLTVVNGSVVYDAGGWGLLAPDFVLPSDRIAAFDNDGTLWSEQPMSANAARRRARVVRHHYSARVRASFFPTSERSLPALHLSFTARME